MVTHTFKNLTAKAARFLQSVSAYFGTLYIKGSMDEMMKNILLQFLNYFSIFQFYK